MGTRLKMPYCAGAARPSVAGGSAGAWAGAAYISSGTGLPPPSCAWAIEVSIDTTLMPSPMLASVSSMIFLRTEPVCSVASRSFSAVSASLGGTGLVLVGTRRFFLGALLAFLGIVMSTQQQWPQLWCTAGRQ